ncbi:MAG: protein-disulfide reductase DsbD family protein [Verrucomicrobiales bacterium]|nr:protein-disulfide reductase DsbD family protein [Verrucomicrobiales bacterium]
MKNIFLSSILSVLLSGWIVAAESVVAQKPGIRTLQLVSDQNSVQPGGSLTISLFIQHEPEYHTYWKAPGIVGVPTSISWKLPSGFKASDLEWPVPQLTKMAQYTAYGYETDTNLLTTITVPETIEGDEVILKARVAFMCCAKNCHPGWHDFELTLPVNRTGKPDIDRKWQKRIAQTIEERPESAPADWLIEASETETEIQVTVASPDRSFREEENLYCFSEDNQINSDSPQSITWSDDRKELTFILKKSGFGPENLKKFSGLLYHPEGWPGVSSNWVYISVPLSSS